MCVLDCARVRACGDPPRCGQSARQPIRSQPLPYRANTLSDFFPFFLFFSSPIVHLNGKQPPDQQPTTTTTTDRSYRHLRLQDPALSSRVSAMDLSLGVYYHLHMHHAVEGAYPDLQDRLHRRNSPAHHHHHHQQQQQLLQQQQQLLQQQQQQQTPDAGRDGGCGGSGDGNGGGVVVDDASGGGGGGGSGCCGGGSSGRSAAFPAPTGGVYREDEELDAAALRDYTDAFPFAQVAYVPCAARVS